MPILLLQLVRACVTEYSHPAPPFCPVRCEKIANRSTRCPVPASRTWQWRTSSWSLSGRSQFKWTISAFIRTSCQMCRRHVRIFNHRTSPASRFLNARAILGPMIPLPKPRGFWDYAFFALVMTGLLMFLFWLEASDAVGWADIALAFATAALWVFAIVLARRAEKATWIAQPTRSAYLLAVLGAFGMMFGAIYADAYLLHRSDITSSRFRHDAVFGVLLTAVTLWSSRRRPPAPTPG